MAIVQISKIQQRSGNIVDLPQLDEAEFGWATDAKRLFIGKTVPNENIEVLTSYSNISFSQVNGAIGNLDITAPVTNGQVLTYDGTNWVNRGGSAAGNINLGDVSNVKITGGAISYVLETDGTGNLSWTPKSSIIAYISAITKANPAVVTTTANNYFTNSSLITITDVNGMTQVNGNSYYVDVLTSNTFALYSDAGLTTPVNSTGYGTYTSNGRAISAVGGSGAAAAGGSNTTIQFNNNNILDGDADFTWNYSTNLLTVNGNANVGNLNASGVIAASRYVSNVATGTAPLTVTSTTRVANLSVTYANVSDFGVVTAQTTGTFYPAFVNGSTTANRALGANANLSFNVATGVLTAAGGLTTTGNITLSDAKVIKWGTGGTNILGSTGANVLTLQLNNSDIAVATIGDFTVKSKITVDTPTGGLALYSANSANYATYINLLNTTAIGIFGIEGNTANSLGSGTLAYDTLISYAATKGLTIGNGTAQISRFSDSGLVVTGNITGSNINTAGNVTASRLISNVATGTAPLTVTSTTRVANLSVNYANVSDFEVVTAQTTGTFYPVFVNGSTTANYALGANSGISVNVATGALAATLLTGTLTTAAQPNVTSVSTSFTNLTFANAQTISGNNMTLTTGANTNAGTITGNWSLSTGSKLQATYADLAEYYSSDLDYAPGTVVEFGGDAEVTLASDASTRVAGVVSTNPAYAMNAKCEGDYVVALALQGRVPCKVRGYIRKGDMMISGGNGYARPSSNPAMGTVIGKALENFNGDDGVIEVAVGRL